MLYPAAEDETYSNILKKQYIITYKIERKKQEKNREKEK